MAEETDAMPLGGGTDLVSDLRRLGVAEGDLLMPHASLRRIGVRADDVLDALEAAIGPDGTLFFTLGARDDWGWVNERPEAERVALLADAEPFDHLTTPADPDNGVLPEVFRTRPGTIVTDHPEGRFGAAGRLAHALLDDDPWDHYYGPGSALEHFVRSGGKVLRMGADPNTTTVIHYAEYLAPVPDKRGVRRHRALANGEIRVVECLDDSDGIVERPGEEDYFTTILQGYLATGAAATGTVGGADSVLIDAADLVDYAVAWMGANLTS